MDRRTRERSPCSIPADLEARPKDAGSARACGAVLAIRERSFAGLQPEPEHRAPAPFGGLVRVHDAVPSPPQEICGSIEDALLLVNVLEKPEAGWHIATRGWDVQLIHGDFYPGNVLRSKGLVTWVLDFEFAGPGHREIDFAIGLRAFSTRDWRNTCWWPVLE